jgi:UPF0271 protein
MGTVTVDLNADLGEGYGVWRLGDDRALLGVVTSANVACGFHAGDPSSILQTLGWAAQAGVVVGAHVSYPDLVGFGRRAMEVSPSELRGDVAYQLGALEGLSRLAGVQVRYVKAHGALYNRVATDLEGAEAVVSAVNDCDPSLVLLCAAGSAIATAGESAGLRVVGEAFADRAYLPDGTLAPRSDPGGVILDESEVVARAVRLASDRVVVALDGTVLPVRAESICVHGDTPGAAGLARAVRQGLARAGIEVCSFVQDSPSR